MGFLDSLKKLFSPPPSSSDFIKFKVKCNRCGEEIEVKARKTSDVSRIYDEEGPPDSVFYLRKEILGNKCNNLIYVTMYFGSTFELLSKDIAGGTFEK